MKLATKLTGLGILAVLAIILVVVGLVLALNFIPWAIYNYALAPAFGWPEAGYWTVFFVIWALQIIGAALFSSRKSN